LHQNRVKAANFRQTFLPTKIFVLSTNQLKAAEASTNIFKNIISKPNNSHSANSKDDEKRERISLRICVSQRWFFLADSISHLSKNWNQIYSEIVIFLLVKNKMIQIGAS